MPPGRRKFSKKTLERMAARAKARAAGKRDDGKKKGEAPSPIDQLHRRKQEEAGFERGGRSSGRRVKNRAVAKLVTAEIQSLKPGAKVPANSAKRRQMLLELRAQAAAKKLAERKKADAAQEARVSAFKAREAKLKAAKRGATKAKPAKRGAVRAQAARGAQGGIKTGPRGGKYREGPGGKRTYIK